MGGLPPQSWEMGFDGTGDFDMAALLEDRPARKAEAVASGCMSQSPLAVIAKGKGGKRLLALNASRAGGRIADRNAAHRCLRDASLARHGAA